ELLRDRIGHQLGVDLGLSDLLDIQAHIGSHHLAQLGAQCLDVLALLADDDPWARAVDGDARILRRALDRDLANGSVGELLAQVIANFDVLVERGRKMLGVRVPLGRPVAVDGEAESGRIDFLSHENPYFLPSPTVTLMWQVCFRMTLPRPFARAVKRRRLAALST